MLYREWGPAAFGSLNHLTKSSGLSCKKVTGVYSQSILKQKTRESEENILR